jgi:hypothetical protein
MCSLSIECVLILPGGGLCQTHPTAQSECAGMLDLPPPATTPDVCVCVCVCVCVDVCVCERERERERVAKTILKNSGLFFFLKSFLELFLENSGLKHILVKLKTESYTM